MRRKFVAGNWKLNTNKTSAVELAKAVAAGVKPGDPRVAVCPPAVYLGVVADAVKGTAVEVGGQNAYSAPAGAFTGENSPAMIKDLGCTLVILGHSERRQYFGETNEGINKKTKAAFDQGLDPIVCVGETLAERQAGKTFEVLKTQLLGSLQGLPADKLPSLVLAYEPVWAIGTGVNATPEQAQEAHAFLRGLVKETFGAKLAEGMVILYGGSVKADNAATLFGQPDVDGGLIGGASLDAKGFLQIVAAGRGA
jgi:triosephosphate isomerase